MGMKREVIRRTLLIYLNCYLSESNREEGKVVDISPKGMLLISSNKIALDQSYQFRITFPKLDSLLTKEILVNAVCKWKKPAEIDGFIYYGFSFKDTCKDHDIKINQLIEKIGFSDGQKKISTVNTGFNFM